MPTKTNAKPGATLEDMERHKASLQAELSELKVGDVKEKEELRADIKELKEYIDAQKKADSERDKIDSSKTTMVVPPADVAPSQPTPTPTTTNESGNKRSKWKDIW